MAARVNSLHELFDLLLRLVFFGSAPLMLVSLAMLFPVTGAVVQIAVALLIFLAGEAARRWVTRWPFLRPLLAGQFAFEAYYRQHPPRPFLYYVCYPLLLPYWLSVPQARREFLLYKGYTLLGFGLLLLSLLVQYFTAFPPELSLRDFAPLAGATLLAESVVVLMFLMPMVTSVVHFHRLRAPRRLGLLLLAGLVSLGFAAARLERRRDPVVSYATRVRVRLRTEARPGEARLAQLRALEAAWSALPQHTDDVERDGKVMDVPLAAAHEQLAGFYKYDEAHAFDLWYSSHGSQKMLVVYFESHRGHAPIWLARDGDGGTTADVQRLPAGAFRAMRHASR